MYRFNDRASLLTARSVWCADPAAARATYGEIGTWDVSRVSDMSFLFCADSGLTSYGCDPACSTFDDDISGWDVSSVTTFVSAFHHANSLLLSECNKAKIYAAWSFNPYFTDSYRSWLSSYSNCPSQSKPSLADVAASVEALSQQSSGGMTSGDMTFIDLKRIYKEELGITTNLILACVALALAAVAAVMGGTSLWVVIKRPVKPGSFVSVPRHHIEATPTSTMAPPAGQSAASII